MRRQQDGDMVQQFKTRLSCTSWEAETKMIFQISNASIAPSTNGLRLKLDIRFLNLVADTPASSQATAS